MLLLFLTTFASSTLVRVCVGSSPTTHGSSSLSQGDRRTRPTLKPDTHGYAFRFIAALHTRLSQKIPRSVLAKKQTISETPALGPAPPVHRGCVCLTLRYLSCGAHHSLPFPPNRSRRASPNAWAHSQVLGSLPVTHHRSSSVTPMPASSVVK